MRSIWSGSISFGLVNIPVKLYSASEERAISFDYLHKKDNSRIRYAKVCQAEKKEIPYEEIVRGFELSEGNYVVLDEKDFERADPKKSKSIEILSFAKEDEVPDIYFEKPYYLEPDKGSDKPFVLLRDALVKAKRVGVAKFVMKNKEHLAVVKPYEDIILLNQLRFSDEIRDTKQLKTPEKKEISKEEIGIALALVDQLTKPFDPKLYKDTYTEELREIIEEKAQGKAPVVRGRAPEPTGVADLMSVLKQSLEKTKTGSK